MWVAVGTADFVTVGFGVGVEVGLGVGVVVGVGVDVPVARSGDGAAELTAAALAAVPAELRLAGAVPVGLVAALGAPTAEFAVADGGWLLVHAPSVVTQRAATSQRAGVGLVVRSRLAMDPG